MADRQASAADRTIILGLETTCDETAAAVVARDADGRGQLLSNVVRSQWAEHAAFGGVVPEIAARAHANCLDHIVADAMGAAEIGFGDLDAVAVSSGPGLVGGLIAGVVTAKAIALSHSLSFIAVNHLEAHALTVGLTDNVLPPYVLLLVSGGHTQVLLVKDVGDYVRLGTTIDDALGEAFDKTAKLLGLPQPGGPAVEAAASRGNAARFNLPRPMRGRPEPHFSFAGLKTALRVQAQALAPLDDATVADLCASFQAAVVETVVERCSVALEQAGPRLDAAIGDRAVPRHFVVAGGVASNAAIRAALRDLASGNGYLLTVPPPGLCTDNAAMVAWAGGMRLARGMVDDMAAPVRPRWPLDPHAAPAAGAGVKA